MEPAALAKHELIGLRCEVSASGDPGLLRLQGEVVDETMRTFTLRTERGERVVAKQGQELTFTLPSGQQQRLRGEDLAHRPEDRTKKSRSVPRSNSPKVNHAHA
ncbi:MAG: ribonuclease P protein subunit [Halobacteriales archaeon]|nr:ribonuclease P protein subunit [Halobacteriales archaeon]